MVGTIQADKTFRMLCGTVDLCGIIDPDGRVTGRVHHQQSCFQGADMMIKLLHLKVFHELFFDLKRSAGQVDLGHTFSFNLVAH